MSDDATLNEFVDSSEGSNNSESGATSKQGTDDLQTLETSPVEEWELVRLGNILSFEYGDNLPADTRQDGEVPVYGSNGQVDTHTEANVNKSGIIIGRKGSIGEGKFSDKSFWAIDTTYYITDEETDENLRFVYYLLQNMKLERLNAASAIPGLNRNDAYNLSTLIPPIAEQRKIATVLHTVDQAIQKTEETIEHLNRIHKGTLRDLFANGIKKEPETHDTPMGQFPKHWELSTMEEVGSLINGTAFPKMYQGTSEGEYPFIKVSDTNDYRRYVSGAKNYISEEVAEEIGCNIHPEGTVILPKRGAAIMTNKRRVLAQDSAIDNNQIGIIGEKVQPLFLYYYLLDVDMGRFAQDGAVKSLTKSLVSKLRVPVPSDKTQFEIVDTLESIDHRIELEEQVKNQQKRFKRGLIQDLLSGTVRTADADMDIPDEITQHG